MLTKERADILSKILTDDQDRAKALSALEPAEALAQINALGYDFTLEELNEFGAAIKSAIQQTDGELSTEALDDVAGGGIRAGLDLIVGGLKEIWNSIKRIEW